VPATPTPPCNPAATTVPHTTPPATHHPITGMLAPNTTMPANPQVYYRAQADLKAACDAGDAAAHLHCPPCHRALPPPPPYPDLVSLPLARAARRLFLPYWLDVWPLWRTPLFAFGRYDAWTFALTAPPAHRLPHACQHTCLRGLFDLTQTQRGRPPAHGVACCRSRPDHRRTTTTCGTAHLTPAYPTAPPPPPPLGRGGSGILPLRHGRVTRPPAPTHTPLRSTCPTPRPAATPPASAVSANAWRVVNNPPTTTTRPFPNGCRRVATRHTPDLRSWRPGVAAFATHRPQRSLTTTTPYPSTTTMLHLPPRPALPSSTPRAPAPPRLCVAQTPPLPPGRCPVARSGVLTADRWTRRLV